MIFFFGVQESPSNLGLNYGYEKGSYTPDFTVFLKYILYKHTK